MKAAELLTLWKPKRRRKVKAPSGFWLVGLAGSALPSSTGPESGDGGSDGGGGIGESIDHEMEQQRAANFGFHPSMRQYWFSIADLDVFLQGQDDWFDRHLRVGAKTPDANYVDWLINNEIMVQKDPNAWRESLAIVLKWGALRGNGSATDQMVFMFDPKKAVPNIRKMRQFGLKPDFTYSGNASETNEGETHEEPGWKPGNSTVHMKEPLNEAKPLSIPKGVAKLPKKIMVGEGGYYLELLEVKPTKAIFKVRRLFDDRPVMMLLFLTRRAIPGAGSHYILQVHGSATDEFTHADRTLKWLDTEFDPFEASVIKDFMKGVLEKAGLLKD